MNFRPLFNEYNKCYLMDILQGDIIRSLELYVNNLEDSGSIQEGRYGNWTIINIERVSILGENTIPYNSKYMLVMYPNEKIFTIQWDDLNTLKNMADTYKEI